MSIFSTSIAPDIWTESVRFNDTILFSRVALRRNISRYPFKDHLQESLRSELNAIMAETLNGKPDMRYYHSADIDRNDISILEEEEFLPQGETPDAVALSSDKSFAFAVNGNSHILIASLSGGNLEDQYGTCAAFDAEINSSVSYAFSDRFGYLFADPADCGSGLEISAVIHIPSISTLKCFPEIRKICADMKLSLSVYPDGAEQEVPHFCKVSLVNDRTLSENGALQKMIRAVTMISDLERDAREEYYYEFKPHVEDAVWRSFGILSNSRMIGYREAFDYLSHVRLGIILSILRGYNLAEINRLFFRIKRSHVILESGTVSSQLDTDQARAVLLRNYFLNGGRGV
jgi:protein arginine kinase